MVHCDNFPLFKEKKEKIQKNWVVARKGDKNPKKYVQYKKNACPRKLSFMYPISGIPISLRSDVPKQIGNVTGDIVRSAFVEL